MHIGVIGTGTITSAAIRGIAGDGHTITVSERNATRAAALARDVPHVTVAPNQTVIDRSDIVLIGLMPDAAPAILSALRFRPGQVVLSLMAGHPLDAVAAMVAPARAAAIMLPFPAIATGNSPILVLGDTAPVAGIFGARNSIVPLADAAELDAYLCAQAVLSPVALLVATAARWLAPRIADAARCESFLRSLVTASLAAQPAEDLIAALDTEGGYNQRLRRHLETAGTDRLVTEGLDRLAAQQGGEVVDPPASPR